MRTRNGRREVLFGTNYPTIFHAPALADLEALAPDDEALTLPNALRLFEKGGPRRLLCLGERERAGQRVWCPQRTRRDSAAPRILAMRKYARLAGGCRPPLSPAALPVAGKAAAGAP